MPLLEVVVASVREARVGLAVAEWFVRHAREHGAFDIELVDLKAVHLPMLDEPHLPRFRKYEFAHTKAWSATVDRADAFVFVTPEYNYGTPPALVNALDYLFAEWAYKPAAFVSYGGVSGGTRAAQMTKSILTTLRMMPIPEAVTIPFVGKLMKDGVFEGATHVGPIVPMLEELLRWVHALAPLRRSA